MAIRAEIYAAMLLILWCPGQAARSEAPPGAPVPRPGRDRLPAMQAGTGTPGGSLAFARQIRPPPPTSVDSSSAASDAVSGPPETLEQAWLITLAVSQALEAKRLGVSSAEHSLQSAQADRWPKVAIQSSYTVRDNEPAFKFDFPGMPLWTNTFPYAQDEFLAFHTRVDLPLYTSGRISHGVAAAAARFSSAELQVDKYTMDLKMQVAGEYVAVLRAQREVDVAECTVKSLVAHLRDVEMLFEHGQVPWNDVLAAQVALSNARQSAIQAHNELAVSQAAYNRRLGRPLTSPLRIAELPLQMPQEDVESLTSRALRARPEIVGLKAQVRALEHQAVSLRATNGPQVAVWGDYAFEENRFRTPQGITAAGVGVSWNVFDGGRNRHQVAAILEQADSLRRMQAELESVIALEVHRAWLDVQQTRRRLELTPQAVQRAEENLRVARKRYTLGAGTNTEVLDAETLRAQAYRNHHNATYDAVLAELRLRHATAELKP